ncbi:MAG TPA: thioredoxin family protein [Trueperaceae bacterium]|nr:thioredoxin family protein [Trueperaceae bacterium]
MAFLDDKIRGQVKDALAGLQHDVQMIVYKGGQVFVPGQDAAGEQDATLQLLREVAELNDHVEVVERTIAGDEEAQALGITRAPTTLFRRKGTERSNMRFAGIPSGYEFTTLLETLLMLGTDELELTPTLESVKEIEDAINLQTFVTPTCPYCPRAVITAFRFALVNDRIVAEGVEANEFPELSQRNRISGVPDTIVTGANATRVLGAQPEHAFAEALRQVSAGSGAQASDQAGGAAAHA